MPEAVFESWPVFAVIIVLAPLVGLIRRDPWWISALTIASCLGFWIGFRWVGTFGREAALAAMVMSVGSVFMVLGPDWARKRRERSRPTGS